MGIDGRRGERLRATLVRPAAWPVLLGVAGWAAVLPLLLRLLPWPAVRALAQRWGNAPPRPGARLALRCFEWLLRRPGARRWLTCLPTALLRYRYLREAGEPAVLHLGIGRAAPAPSSGRRIGHAWVTLRGALYGEPPSAVENQIEMLRFAPETGAAPPAP